MAKFDLDDFAGRQIRLVPTIWFSSAARKVGGNFYAVMAGLGEGLAFLYAQIQTLKANSRILATSDIGVLTLASQDFFAGALPPLANETANQYRARILARLFLPGGTRDGIGQAVTNLTGTAPVLIEPWNPNDCGAYDTGPWGYDVAGAWGDLNLPWTGFARVQRPTSVVNGSQDFAMAYDAGYAGWDSPYGDYPDLQSSATIPDAAIFAAVQANKAYGTTVWVQLQ